MFERSRSANVDKARIGAVITMVNGEKRHGTIAAGMTLRLADALNSSDPFLDFESHDGEQVFIAKQAVASVKPVGAPKADQLSGRLRRIDVFDPHAILGLKRGATAEAVRGAYHRLVRSYHPDRFAGLDLPKEVQDYAHAMLTRINLAFEQLERGSD